MHGPKPVPMEDAVIPATDATRRRDSNISPQGHVRPDDAPRNSKFTPEGDNENVPGIMPSANDPV